MTDEDKKIYEELFKSLQDVNQIRKKVVELNKRVTNAEMDIQAINIKLVNEKDSYFSQAGQQKNLPRPRKL